MFDAKSCNCFTKNYNVLLKGSGLIVLINKEVYQPNLDLKTVEGYLSYFTPGNIQTAAFSFSPSLTLKSKYKLIGNSVE